MQDSLHTSQHLTDKNRRVRPPQQQLPQGSTTHTNTNLHILHAPTPPFTTPTPEPHHSHLFNPTAHLAPPAFPRTLNLDPLAHLYPLQEWPNEYGWKNSLQQGFTIETHTKGNSCYPRMLSKSGCRFTPVHLHEHLDTRPINTQTGRLCLWWYA